MRKPTIDDLKLWHIVVGAQYLLLGILALVCMMLDRIYGQNVDFVLLFFGAAFFVLVSLVAFLCSLFEKSIVGALIAAAPFYVPVLVNVLR